MDNVVQARRKIVTENQRNHLEKSHCWFDEVGGCIGIISER
jgi:hypothetical protein